MTKHDLLQEATRKADESSLGSAELQVDYDAAVVVTEPGYWVEAWIFVAPPKDEKVNYELGLVIDE